MKKLLIIQQDDAYFLFETLVLIDNYRDIFKDFDLTLLVNQSALEQLEDGSVSLLPGITTNSEQVLRTEFDLSVNLSLIESSWTLHGQINSKQKTGPYYLDNQLWVPDSWSSFFLTLKGRAPFLTFHLQDIFKNILGIKRITPTQNEKRTYNTVAFGFCNTDLFPSHEQEKLVSLIHQHHPHLKILDISETDPVSDLTHVLYIGPASLASLKISEAGALGIFLTGQFQGFNLLPHGDGNLVVSSRQTKFHAESLMPIIDSEIHHKEITTALAYSVYKIGQENLFGSHLESLNISDETYPIYQAHVVLWNFVLNLFDVNLEITRCTPEQITLLSHQIQVLKKLVRLYDYAMSSIDTIHLEAKATRADSQKIQGHLKNLQEIEEISDKISQSNSFLRPVLDYYRIRRGQNQGSTLLEQSQHSFLTYSEEHQALQALLELFTVTLHKNEVNI